MQAVPGEQFGQVVEEASAIMRAGRFISETVAEAHGGIANERRDTAAFPQRSEFDLVASDNSAGQMPETTFDTD